MKFLEDGSFLNSGRGEGGEEEDIWNKTHTNIWERGGYIYTNVGVINKDKCENMYLNFVLIILLYFFSRPNVRGWRLLSIHNFGFSGEKAE